MNATEETKEYRFAPGELDKLKEIRGRRAWIRRKCRRQRSLGRPGQRSTDTGCIWQHESGARLYVLGSVEGEPGMLWCVLLSQLNEHQPQARKMPSESLTRDRRWSFLMRTSSTR